MSGDLWLGCFLDVETASLQCSLQTRICFLRCGDALRGRGRRASDGDRTAQPASQPASQSAYHLPARRRRSARAEATTPPPLVQAMEMTQGERGLAHRRRRSWRHGTQPRRPCRQGAVAGAHLTLSRRSDARRSDAHAAAVTPHAQPRAQPSAACRYGDGCFRRMPSFTLRPLPSPSTSPARTRSGRSGGMLLVARPARRDA